MLFQCEIWNMTSLQLDVNNKWVCTFHTGICRLSKSQIEWTKKFPVQICPDPYIWNVTSLDVNKFRTGRVSNTMAFYTIFFWGKRLVIFFPLSEGLYLLENECITKLSLTLETLFKIDLKKILVTASLFPHGGRSYIGVWSCGML